MQRIRTEAVTYAARDLGEADRIIDFLTRDLGRISAVARGARRSRKRFGGRLEKFVCVELHALERAPGALAHIEDVRVKESFPALTSGLDRLSMAEVWLEFSGRFAVPGSDGEATFDHMLDVWRTLQHGLSESGFYLGLLLALGRQGMLAPLNRCTGCGVSALMYFGESGGVLCAACKTAAAKVLSKHLAERFAELPEAPEPEDWAELAGDESSAELRSLVRCALDWYAGGPFRALQVWEESLLNR